MRTKNRTRVCGLLGRSQDETVADVEGMVAALQEQIDLLERQIVGEIVALHR